MFHSLINVETVRNHEWTYVQQFQFSSDFNQTSKQHIRIIRQRASNFKLFIKILYMFSLNSSNEVHLKVCIKKCCRLLLLSITLENREFSFWLSGRNFKLILYEFGFILFFYAGLSTFFWFLSHSLSNNNKTCNIYLYE